MKEKQIFLCAINNILSGSCNEDCVFCTQSVQHKADIDRYTLKPLASIVSEARQARAQGALGYCLVTAGRGLDDKKTLFIAEAAQAIKKEIDGLHLIACNGTASKEQLRFLKEHGIDSYNHNLETSPNYYPAICTTHSWKERYATCENAKSIGLKLCTGGIFGMGETIDDRDELQKAIYSLRPESIPLNFFHHNPALPINPPKISQNEAIRLISQTREMNGEHTMLMVAGGRELYFADEEYKMFEAGANAIVLGNYLTTSGEAPAKDLAMLARFGYEAATRCNN
jgi:biotin synthase